MYKSEAHNLLTELVKNKAYTSDSLSIIAPCPHKTLSLTRDQTIKAVTHLMRGELLKSGGGGGA